MDLCYWWPEQAVFGFLVILFQNDSFHILDYFCHTSPDSLDFDFQSDQTASQALLEGGL